MLKQQPSRNELILWISTTTELPMIHKIEALADGIYFLELFNKMYPNVLNMKKVNRTAKSALEKERNFKILLNGMTSMHMNYPINIVDLSLGKIPALLHLLQIFFKEYHDYSKIGERNFNKSVVSASRVSQPRFKTYGQNLVAKRRSFSKDQRVNGEQQTRSNRSLDMKYSPNSKDLSRATPVEDHSQSQNVHNQKRPQRESGQNVKGQKATFQNPMGKSKRKKIKVQLTEEKIASLKKGISQKNKKQPWEDDSVFAVIRNTFKFKTSAEVQKKLNQIAERMDAQNKKVMEDVLNSPSLKQKAKAQKHSMSPDSQVNQYFQRMLKSSRQPHPQNQTQKVEIDSEQIKEEQKIIYPSLDFPICQNHQKQHVNLPIEPQNSRGRQPSTPQTVQDENNSLQVNVERTNPKKASAKKNIANLERISLSKEQIAHISGKKDNKEQSEKVEVSEALNFQNPESKTIERLKQVRCPANIFDPHSQCYKASSSNKEMVLLPQKNYRSEHKPVSSQEGLNLGPVQSEPKKNSNKEISD